MSVAKSLLARGEAFRGAVRMSSVVVESSSMGDETGGGIPSYDEGITLTCVMFLLVLFR
jgi:hypothetical protein